MARTDTVADLANWSPPQRLIRVPGGRPIIEKLSPLLSRKVVDLQGNVKQQPASNGIANRSPNDPYGMQTHAEKLQGRPRHIKGTPGGILPFSKCPQGIGHATPFLEELGIGGRPICQSAHNGKPISNTDACACIVEVIEKRQAAHRRINDENEARVNRLAKLAEQTAQANLDASTKMAEAATALAAAAASTSKKRGDDK